MTITLHHLNKSRSARILWLLEEAGLPYTLVSYQRDSRTQLAPPELLAIHPLGKSPIIEDNGRVIAESGAIIEYLIQRYAPHLAPDTDDPEYVDYLQWIHFAESSAMLPVLLRVFNQFETESGTQLNFLENYAYNEFSKVFAFIEKKLEKASYLVGDHLTGADIMLGFTLDTALNSSPDPEHYPAIRQYLERLKQLKSWIRATEIEEKG